MSIPNNKNRVGHRLQDGKAAHTKDHQAWSRRQFLSMSGIMATGGALMGGSPLFGWASPLLSSIYNNPDNDRVLILIRLSGGNDGLNTIVPLSDSDAVEGGFAGRRMVYESARPNLKIAAANCNSLLEHNMNTPDFGLPKLFKGTTEELGMYHLWEQDRMAVIHNVGYNNTSGSHFLGSDLWASGAVNDPSANDQRRFSGWMGRYFNETIPNFMTSPPAAPPAIQIGTSNNLIFRTVEGSALDMVFTNNDVFNAFINSGQLYNTDNFQSCIADLERIFLRDTNNNALNYAQAIQAAWSDDNNSVGYETGNTLAQNMSIVANLIKGGLGTKIYLVTLGGFDTHADQGSTHLELLRKVSSAIKSTYDDLDAEGHADRVLMMTFSEFGRTTAENSGGGTDHGTLAPVMLFGNAVNGKKFYGTPIDLSEATDDSSQVVGNGKVTFNGQAGAIDFRAVYDNVLRNWLCADTPTSDNVLQPYTACNGSCNNLESAIVPCFTTSCPTQLTVTQADVSGDYHASDQIQTDDSGAGVNVNSGDNLSIKAGNRVRINAGFSVKSGAEFHADVEDCQ